MIERYRGWLLYLSVFCSPSFRLLHSWLSFSSSYYWEGCFYSFCKEESSFKLADKEFANMFMQICYHNNTFYGNKIRNVCLVNLMSAWARLFTLKYHNIDRSSGSIQLSKNGVHCSQGARLFQVLRIVPNQGTCLKIDVANTVVPFHLSIYCISIYDLWRTFWWFAMQLSSQLSII
jgi:hypothetical protein